LAQVVSEKQNVQNPTNSLIKLIIFLPDENHPIEDKQIWSWDDVITVTKNMNSSVHLDKFVYDPNKSTGDVAIQATRGVFRFATGSLGSDAYKIRSLMAPWRARLMTTLRDLHLATTAIQRRLLGRRERKLAQKERGNLENTTISTLN
jgi:hypothetical protein